MTCTYCNGTQYAKIPGGVAPCNACEAGRRMIEAREAHATRYRPRQRERKAIVKRAASGKERAAGK